MPVVLAMSAGTSGPTKVGVIYSMERRYFGQASDPSELLHEPTLDKHLLAVDLMQSQVDSRIEQVDSMAIKCKLGSFPWLCWQPLLHLLLMILTFSLNAMLKNIPGLG